MFTIQFRWEDGSQRTIEGESGEDLLDLARKQNIAIDAPCSGNASCGKCRVKLLSGSITSEKTRHITDEDYAEGWRLSCASKIAGDVVLLIPDTAAVCPSGTKTADVVTLWDTDMQNAFSCLELELDPPSPEDMLPDNERLQKAVQLALDSSKVWLSFSALQKLPSILRKSDFRIQCILCRKPEGILVMDVMPAGSKTVMTGIAVDIGTTTVSALLADLETGEILAKAAAGNRQFRYGADVIHRMIEAARPSGSRKLQEAILEETLLPLFQRLCKEASVPADQVYEISISANTTMNHLLIGADTEPVRREPFVPVFLEMDEVSARELGIPVSPAAMVKMAPNVGSYVGGDITAGVLASGIWNRPEYTLLIDLGTNGELVFGNEDFLITCACSAGPAFEGGDISCGMRAADGAIEACRIDPDTWEPELTVVGDRGQKPLGLCGSGIIDVISELFRHGVIDARGRFIRECRRVRQQENGIRSYVLAFQEETGTAGDITLTEIDIESFIRAKGAIFSAIQVMLSAVNFDFSMLDQVYVAGGIGSGINVKNAVQIGLFPDIPLEKYQYIGNSSLSGAYAMLVSSKAEEQLREIARNMTYLELSTHPGYMEEFVAACFLPHTNGARFPSVNYPKR